MNKLIGIAVLLSLGFLFYKVMFRQTARRGKPYHKSNLPADSQSSFIVCTFSMLGKLSAVDGTISPEEIKRVEIFCRDTLALDSQTIDLAMRVFNEAADSPLEIRDYAMRFKETYPERVQLLDRMVETLIQVSTADGELAETEDRAINSVALLLGLSDQAYRRIKSKYIEEKIIH